MGKANNNDGGEKDFIENTGGKARRKEITRKTKT
jgi:hypothetical protein